MIFDPKHPVLPPSFALNADHKAHPGNRAGFIDFSENPQNPLRVGRLWAIMSVKSKSMPILGMEVL